MNRKLTMAAVAVSAALLATGVGLVGPAQADSPVSDTALAGVGSDTTDKVMQGLADASGGLIANFEATGSTTFATRVTDNDCKNLTRSAFNGSSAGVRALVASIQGVAFGGSTNLSGCIDFARSSSGNPPSFSAPLTTPAAGSLTYIPFAKDTVTYAVLGNTAVPKNLTIAELKDIYSRNTGNCLFEPLIPQQQSGTSGYWITTALGFTSTVIGGAGGPGTCVKAVNAANQPIQEHDGRFLVNGNQLVPFSVAQYISMGGDVQEDLRGRAVLGSINWNVGGTGDATPPLLLQQSFGQGSRTVYNVVSTPRVGETAIQNAFVGASSVACGATGDAVVAKFGFGVLDNATCGTTTLVKP